MGSRGRVLDSCVCTVWTRWCTGGKPLTFVGPKQPRRPSATAGSRAPACSPGQLRKLPTRPKVFICASAVDSMGRVAMNCWTKPSAPGQGFLADVCRQWEEAAAPARDAGLRTVHLRSGIVLSRQGGMLARVLPRFKMGAGVVVGTGRQWMSWISLADATAAIQYAITAADLSGQ